MENNKPKKKKRGFYMTMHLLLAGIIRRLLRVKIVGKENIPTEGGALVCINHIAAWDVLTVACVFPRPLRFLAKKELFKIPVLSGIMRAFGAFGIDRGGSDVGAIKKSVSVVEDGELLAIFPQGTRRAGLNPLKTEIKGGAGMMLYRSKAPALPVCIKMKKMKYLIFRRVEVIVGRPVEYSALGFTEGGRSEYDAAARSVFDEVCRLGGFLPASEPKEDGK